MFDFHVVVVSLSSPQPADTFAKGGDRRMREGEGGMGEGREGVMGKGGWQEVARAAGVRVSVVDGEGRVEIGRAHV